MGEDVLDPSKVRTWTDLNLNLEYVAQSQEGGEPAGSDAAATSASGSTTPAPALPLPSGASEYLGWFEHCDLGGCMRLRLRVTHAADENGVWGGVLICGSKLGYCSHVTITIEDQGMGMSSRTMSGRQEIELSGKHLRRGVMLGDVTVDGTPGGRFRLWPAEPRVAQLQEWFVALVSGNCMDLVERSVDPEAPSECAICLECFAPGDVLVRTMCTSQGHLFHRKCIAEWLRSKVTCPLCRHPLAEADRENLLSASAGSTNYQWLG